MHVVVCIVAFRNPGDVAACLDAVGQSAHRDFEVVIAENGGDAAHADTVRRFMGTLPGGQSVSVLPDEGNTGYAGGNNLCIAARPDADLWWILNPDTRIAPDAMGLLADHLARGKSDAVGGAVLSSSGLVQSYGGEWTTVLARARSIGRGERPDPARRINPEEIDYISGASLMLTPHFLAVAGPMREDYFLYGEEVEWCLRAKLRGLTLGVEPRAVIAHAQGTTTGDGGTFGAKPWLPVYLDQRNKLLILRDYAPALLPVGAIGALAMLTGRAAKNCAWRQLGYGLSGWFSGLLGKRGVPDKLAR